MKFLFLSFLILLVSGSSAQFLEKVYLKDSTLYTGWIVEQVPQVYIKILRQKERDTFQIATDQIWKIVRVINADHPTNPFYTVTPARRSQALFVELGGNGIFYSLNYDTRFNRLNRYSWGFRAGAGVITLPVTDSVNQFDGRITLISLPIEINRLIGKKKSAFEVGLGLTPFIADLKGLTSDEYGNNLIVRELKGTFTLAVISTIGYRYTSSQSGLLFKIALNPTLYNGTVSLWAGIAVGYHFQRK